MLGNLIENAAKYGSGWVFVTVERNGEFIDILIEDDGPGIPEERRAELFGRCARLATSKPGTGLGLSIVRVVVGIYGDQIRSEEHTSDLQSLMRISYSDVCLHKQKLEYTV